MLHFVYPFLIFFQFLLVKVSSFSSFSSFEYTWPNEQVAFSRLIYLNDKILVLTQTESFTFSQTGTTFQHSSQTWVQSSHLIAPYSSTPIKVERDGYVYGWTLNKHIAIVSPAESRDVFTYTENESWSTSPDSFYCTTVKTQLNHVLLSFGKTGVGYFTEVNISTNTQRENKAVTIKIPGLNAFSCVYIQWDTGEIIPCFYTGQDETVTIKIYNYSNFALLKTISISPHINYLQKWIKLYHISANYLVALSIASTDTYATSSVFVSVWVVNNHKDIAWDNFISLGACKNIQFDLWKISQNIFVVYYSNDVVSPGSDVTYFYFFDINLNEQYQTPLNYLPGTQGRILGWDYDFHYAYTAKLSNWATDKKAFFINWDFPQCYNRGYSYTNNLMITVTDLLQTMNRRSEGTIHLDIILTTGSINYTIDANNKSVTFQMDTTSTAYVTYVWYDKIHPSMAIPSLSYCTWTIKLTCYHTCTTCSQRGDAGVHRCVTCAQGLYFKEGTSNCVNTGDKGYFFDNSLQKYMHCYYTCSSCTAKGTETNQRCVSCIDNFKKLENKPENCYSTPPKGYYNDQEQPHQFMKCYSSCQECVKGGNDTLHNCLVCNSGYAFWENKSNCYLTNTSVFGYYFYYDSSLSPSFHVFKKCYEGCNGCTATSTITTPKCVSCAFGYYAKSNDSTFCRLKTSVLQSYYFDSSSNLFKPCYNNCVQCYGPGTADNHQCSLCKREAYKTEEKEFNCYESSNPEVSGYYYSSIHRLFKKCHPSCKTCALEGTDDDPMCLTCKDGYYKVENKNTVCNAENTALPGYYLNRSWNVFSVIQVSHCLSGSENFCTRCEKNYYLKYINNNNANECHPKFDLESNPDLIGYYLDENWNRFEMCDGSCKSCFGSADEKGTNCKECNSTYSYKINTFPYQCHLNGDGLSGYYENQSLTKSVFLKCFPTCKTCVGGSSLPTVNNQYCTSCPPLSILIPYNCNSGLLDGAACYHTCLKCWELGNEDDHKCVTCKDGYTGTTNSTNCYKDDFKSVSNRFPNGYYHNGVFQWFQQCHYSCWSCAGEKNNNSHKCTACAEGFYQRVKEGGVEIEGGLDSDGIPIQIESFSCYPRNESPGGYYFDTTLQKHFPCFSSCKYCSQAGNEVTGHNCDECKDNFLPWANNTSNCYSKDSSISGYYSNFTDDTISPAFAWCYKSCKTCSGKPSSSSHNCIECAPNYYKLNIAGDTRCFHVDSSWAGYFYNTSSQLFESCNNGCLICKSSTECVKCDNQNLYYPKITSMNQCFYEYNNNNNSGFYLDRATNILSLCNWGCSYCSDRSSHTNHNCWSKNCVTSYNYLPDKPTFCFLESQPPVGYYYYNYYYSTNLRKCTPECWTCNQSTNNNCTKCSEFAMSVKDEPNKCRFIPDAGTYYNSTYNQIEKCYESCNSCGSFGDSDFHNCDKCNTGYFRWLDNVWSCYKSTDNYYKNTIQMEDSITTVWSPCYPTCKTCHTEGDKYDNECISCIDDYYLAEGTKNCYQRSENPDGFYFDTSASQYKKCYLICKTCVESGDAVNHKCTQCIGEYSLLHTGNCQSIYESSLEWALDDIAENFIDIGRSFASSYITDTTVLGNGYRYTVYDASHLSYPHDLGTTQVNWGECWDVLRLAYNVSGSHRFIVSQLEVWDNSKYNNPTMFQVFTSTGVLVDKVFCQDSQYTMEYKLKTWNNIPENNVNITYTAEMYSKYGYDLLDVNSQVFNDICTNFTDDILGKDVLLKERREKYYQNGEEMCEFECDYHRIDYQKMQIVCQCEGKGYTVGNYTHPFVKADKDFPRELQVNMAIAKCYQVLNNVNLLFKNPTVCIVFLLLLIQLTLFFVYFGRQRMKKKSLMNWGNIGGNPIQKQKNKTKGDNSRDNQGYSISESSSGSQISKKNQAQGARTASTEARIKYQFTAVSRFTSPIISITNIISTSWIMIRIMSVRIKHLKNWRSSRKGARTTSETKIIKWRSRTRCTPIPGGSSATSSISSAKNSFSSPSANLARYSSLSCSGSSCEYSSYSHCSFSIPCFTPTDISEHGFTPLNGSIFLTPSARRSGSPSWRGE